MQGDMTFTAGEGLNVRQEGNRIFISSDFSKPVSFEELDDYQKADLWNALMSVMLMGVSLSNKHGFLVLRYGGIDYDVDTPLKFLRVCADLSSGRAAEA